MIQDIKLWSLLQQPELSPESLSPLLDQLASSPIEKRIPFFGMLQRCFSHEDPILRSSALKVLAGATGYQTWSVLVDALSDEQDNTKNEALSALFSSSQESPLRWSHVLFHEDPEIRAQGLRYLPDKFPKHVCLHLLSDEYNHHLAQQVLKSLPEIPKELGLLLDLLDDGRLTSNQVTNWIAQLPWDKEGIYLLQKISHGHHRPEALPMDLLAIEELVTAPGAMESLLDRILGLFWQEIEDSWMREEGQLSSADLFFEKLYEGLRQGCIPPRQHTSLAISIARIAFLWWSWHPLPLAIVSGVMPTLLTHAQIPLEIRKKACALLNDRISQCTFQDPIVHGIHGELCRHEDQTLDLESISGLLQLCQENPVTLLLEHVTKDEVVATLQAHPETILHLCNLQIEEHQKPLVRQWLQEVLECSPNIKEHPKWRQAKGNFPETFQESHFLKRELAPSSLTTSQSGQLLKAPETQLSSLLAPVYQQPTTGLTKVLEQRKVQDLHYASNLQLCSALLACHDTSEEVDLLFSQLTSHQAKFLEDLDQIATRKTRSLRKCSLLGNAWFHLWENRLDDFETEALLQFAGFQELLKWAENLRTDVLRYQIWMAVYHLFKKWKWRTPNLFGKHYTETFHIYLEQVTTQHPEKELTNKCSFKPSFSIGKDASSEEAPLSNNQDWSPVLQFQASEVATALIELSRDTLSQSHPKPLQDQGKIESLQKSSNPEKPQTTKANHPLSDLYRVCSLLGKDRIANLTSQQQALLENIKAHDLLNFARGICFAGDRWANKIRFLRMIEKSPVGQETKELIYQMLLENTQHRDIQNEILRRLNPSKSKKLNELAKLFAWGIRTARSLTGQLFSLELTGGEGLGYTKFSESRIFINPLPLLNQERNGQNIIKGLILHELGHHMFHVGQEAEAIWKQAEDENLMLVLNLVADEHLERNLRAKAQEFGDSLKSLSSYAFQHSNYEADFLSLLQYLGVRAFTVLSTTKCQAARQDGHIFISVGKVFFELESQGLSFARFIRALRMGLGNRHRDHKVSNALQLFKKRSFRHSSMEGLLDTARKLKVLFGHETELLSVLSQENTTSAHDTLIRSLSEGIQHQDLRRELYRELQPGENHKDPTPNQPHHTRVINLNQNENFAPFSRMFSVPFYPEQTRRYIDKIRDTSQHLRGYLRRLGLDRTFESGRVRGMRIDRHGISKTLLRGDPRILRARKNTHKTDLFLGVLIDCSDSMKINDNLEKAKLFSCLIAHAAKGMQGIHVRFFGFNHNTIFDAGNPQKCAVPELRAEGGNNDAAALWYASRLAQASFCKARLLVMLSDSSPTECSTAALHALIKRLTNRMNISCAQIALRSLEESPFPHYVELPEMDLQHSVRRFGEIITRMIHKVLRHA